MRKSEFTFVSSNGKTTIHGVLWEPVGPVKGILQIAHGITEHMGRYEKMARYFTDRGFALAGHDHLGHGRSMDPADPAPMYFGPKGSWDFVVDDIRLCNVEIRARVPEVPCCLLGFSLGSFAVRCALEKTPDLADMTIWAGTGFTSPLEIAMASAICKKEEKRYGDRTDTPLLHKLTIGQYNTRFAPNRTDLDWLFASPEAAADYQADPLTGDGFTVSAFRELLTGMKRSGCGSHFAALRKDMPVVLFSGSDDPVGKCGKGVTKVWHMLHKHRIVNAEMRLFPGMRHHILGDTGHEEVFWRIEEAMEQFLAL